METGHPSTRVVNSGSGNRALLNLRFTEQKYGGHNPVLLSLRTNLQVLVLVLELQVLVLEPKVLDITLIQYNSEMTYIYCTVPYTMMPRKVFFILILLLYFLT